MLNGTEVKETCTKNGILTPLKSTECEDHGIQRITYIRIYRLHSSPPEQKLAVRSVHSAIYHIKVSCSRINIRSSEYSVIAWRDYNTIPAALY